jgi:hypothetical protein
MCDDAKLAMRAGVGACAAVVQSLPRAIPFTIYNSQFTIIENKASPQLDMRPSREAWMRTVFSVITHLDCISSARNCEL